MTAEHGVASAVPVTLIIGEDPYHEVGIQDVVSVEFVDGQWIASNEHWVGYAEQRIDAILNYLRQRLGSGDMHKGAES